LIASLHQHFIRGSFQYLLTNVVCAVKYIKNLFLGVVLGGLTAMSGWAQSPGFLNAADESRQLTELASRYRNISAVTEIGKSAGGRSIMAIEIGSGDRSKKPALLVMGGVDPEDLSGSAASFQFAKYLLEQSAVDSVKAVLDKYTVYVIPRVSPDPLESYFRKPLMAMQGNDKKDDADRDGQMDEDGPSDLNGDGVVAMMRVLDPAGEWMLHPDNNKLMRKADSRKGEVGKYMLMREGKDDDGDKKVNEDAPGGINVNKNTTFNPISYTSDGGRHPFESVEARAMADFIFERPNIIATFTFSYVDNISRPWRIKYPRTPGPNRFTADSTAHAYLTNWIRPMSKFTGVDSEGGDVTNWAYWHAGRFSFGAPAWSFPADSTRRATGGQGGQQPAPNMELLALKWYESNDPSGFMNWSPITHPDFPGRTVELGWFKPFALQNAPTASLQTEAGNSASKMLFRLASGLPELDVPQPRVENLGGGVYRVTVMATNKGKIPTHSEIGRSVKGHNAFLIRTKLANNQKLAMGSPTTFINQPVKGGETVMQTFLITGRGSVQFEVGSPSIGMRTVSVNLN